MIEEAVAAGRRVRRGGGRGRHHRAGRVGGLRPHVAGPARPPGRAGGPGGGGQPAHDRGGERRLAGADAVGGRRGGDPADLVPRAGGAAPRWPTCCSASTEPGGRLPTTWPRAEAGLPGPRHRARETASVAYDEGVFVGYRGWLRSGKTPLYAFGHGLGYTTLDLRRAGGRRDRGGGDADQHGRALRPRGRPGLRRPRRPPDADAARRAGWPASPNVEAHPGETVTVRIPLPQRTFQIWDDGWRPVPGEYTVTAAHAVDDLRLSASLEISAV